MPTNALITQVPTDASSLRHGITTEISTAPDGSGLRPGPAPSDGSYRSYGSDSGIDRAVNAATFSVTSQSPEPLTSIDNGYHR